MLAASLPFSGASNKLRTCRTDKRTMRDAMGRGPGSMTSLQFVHEGCAGVHGLGPHVDGAGVHGRGAVGLTAWAAWAACPWARLVVSMAPGPHGLHAVDHGVHRGPCDHNRVRLVVDQQRLDHRHTELRNVKGESANRWPGDHGLGPQGPWAGSAWVPRAMGMGWGGPDLPKPSAVTVLPQHV